MEIESISSGSLQQENPINIGNFVVSGKAQKNQGTLGTFQKFMQISYTYMYTTNSILNYFIGRTQILMILNSFCSSNSTLIYIISAFLEVSVVSHLGYF